MIEDDLSYALMSEIKCTRDFMYRPLGLNAECDDCETFTIS